MSQVIRSKRRKGQAVQIVVYDMRRGANLPEDFVRGLEDIVERYVTGSSLDGAVAITTSVE